MAPQSIQEIFNQLEVDEDVLNEELDTKYHGPTARKRLFARHRWHHTQREIMHTDNEAESEVCIHVCIHGKKWVYFVLLD